MCMQADAMTARAMISFVQSMTYTIEEQERRGEHKESNAGDC